MYAGDLTEMMRFVRGCITHFLNGVPFYLNVSPVIMVWNANTNVYTLCYASQNYFWFSPAFVCHSDASLSSFYMNFASTDLNEKMAEARLALSSKYEGSDQMLISLLFSVTRAPNVIWGANYSGVIPCCSQSTQKPSTTCVFNSLSAFLDCKLQKRVKHRMKVNKKISLAIQKKFMAYLQQKNIDPTTVVSKEGFCPLYLPILEKFLDRGINIWEKKMTHFKKVGNMGIKQTKIQRRFVRPLYLTNFSSKDKINLFLKNTDKSHLKHIYPVTNPQIFGHKFFLQILQWEIQESNQLFHSSSKMFCQWK